MIATINSDCSILTLQSDALIEAPGKTITGLTLKSSTNCSSTESELNITSLIGSITNEQVLISASLFYDNETSTSFCDAVYHYTLSVTYDISGTEYLIEDSACLLIGCDLKCKVLEYWNNTKDNKAWFLYYALLQGNDCDSCNCTDMCLMYTDLKLLINDNSISSNSGGCGCS